jgi:hypothetical protein
MDFDNVEFHASSLNGSSLLILFIEEIKNSKNIKASYELSSSS